MIYINRNSAIEQFKNIIDNDFNKTTNYMPDNFHKQQLNALDLLKKRVFLEEIVEESISFNRQLNWEDKNKNLKLVNCVEDLINVFKLRSDVYTKIGYQEEYPETIEGLNFDNYDKNSAILCYKNNNKLSGTLRLIFDSNNKLPTEDKFSFDNLRNTYKKIGELSRFAIQNESKGLSLEFKNLFAGIHNIFINNDIDLITTSIKKEHYKLYSKFGGTEIIQEMNNYGKIAHEAYSLTWNPSLASNFFKRAFLK
ncbi:MAG: GNAT family N-acetyltransferase [Sulfurimonas sp.]|nr:GNAT family N-acetyltransferase [Sulfurimonas sp.]MCK4973628.1 GNAT family N-acetyltransferase [Sulfurimonas sp.]